MRRRAISVLCALAFAAITAAVGWSVGAPVDFLVLDTTLGVLFIASGAVAWRRRPDLPTGPLLVLSGVLWFVGSYGPTPIPPLSAIGFALSGLYDLPLAFLLLTYPGERLAGARALAVGALGAGLFGRVAGRLLLNDPPQIYPEFCAECPANPFAILASRTAFESVESATNWLIAAAALAVGILAIVRWARSRPFLRRVGWPLFAAGVLAMSLAALDAAEFAIGVALLELEDPLGILAGWLPFIARALIPLGFLAGTLRLRRQRLGVAEAALQAGGTSAVELERALSNELSDPELRVLRWSPSAGAYLDSEGRPVTIPRPGDPTRAVAYIEDDGAPYAAVVHDALLGEERSIVASIQAAARHALAGEDLRAGVGRRIDTADLPQGDVTLLFSDIEGSTAHLQRLGLRYADVLEQHRAIIRDAIRDHGGSEVESVGDEFFAAFSSPTAAVQAAVAIQRAMRRHAWPDGLPIAVRIGVHRGSPTLTPTGYVGLDVHRAARIMSTANGGQILASEAVTSAVAEDGSPAMGVRPLGPHGLRGLSDPVALAVIEAPDLDDP